jgi:HAD superfamily hydrolase (TIGR01490 family)
MRSLAVFDIDGTIFRYSLFIELFNEFVEQKIFSDKANIEVERDLKEWINRNKTFNDYTNTLVDSFFENLNGVSVKDFSKLSLIVSERNKEKVYRYTRELIKDLKQKNFYLLAISGSSQEMVSHFAAFHKFDYFIGSRYEIKNDVYTGKIEFDSFSHKDKVLKDFLDNSSLKFDLENSFAVGDTKDDISMLEMVGNPIAFNPSSELAKVARDKKWKIVVERKDVIYEINNFNFVL